MSKCAEQKLLTDNTYLKDAIIAIYQECVNDVYYSDDITPENKHNIFKPHRENLRMFTENLTFGEASEFDMHYLGIDTPTLYWCDAYNDPKHGDIIMSGCLNGVLQVSDY